MKKFFLIVFIFINYSIFSQSPEVIITTGHSRLISVFDISKEGVYLASSSGEHIVKIWDIKSGKEISKLNNQTEKIDNEARITAIKFLNKENKLLTTDENGLLKIWNITNEKVDFEFEAGFSMPYHNFDINDSILFFVNKNYQLSMLNVNTGEKKDILDDRMRLIKVIPSQKDKILFLDLKNVFHIYDLSKKQTIKSFQIPEKQIFRLSIDKNGEYLCTTSGLGTINIISIESGEILTEISNIKPFHLSFNPVKSELIILHLDRKTLKIVLSIFKGKKYKEREDIKAENIKSTSSFSISKNGEYIAVNSMKSDNKSVMNTIDILDKKSGKFIKSLESRASGIWKIVAAKNSPRVASLGKDFNLRIWNLSNLQIEKVIKFTQNIAINRNGNIIAVKGYNNNKCSYGSIMLYNLDSLKTISCFEYIDIISDMKFSADDKYLILSHINGNIKIVESNSGKVYKSFKGIAQGNQRTAMSINGEYAASTASGIKGIKIYNLKDDTDFLIENAHPLLGASDIDFSSDGKYLFSGSFDQEMKAWDVKTGELVKDYGKSIGPISSVAISYDNSEIASATMGSPVTISDYAVNIWNTETQKQICKLTGHEGTVNSVAFNNMKHLAFSGGDDGMLKVWNLDSCKEVLSCIAVGYDDYIFITPDYYYTGSKEALKGVGFKLNGTTLYPFEQFDLRLNRPDILSKRIKLAPKELIDAFEKAYKKRLEKMGFKSSMLNNDFNIPKVEILNKKDIGFNTKDKKIILRIKASDEKYSLNRINIWINNVPIYGRNGIDLSNSNTKNIEKEITLNLSQGNNKIQVSAINSKGAESLKETIVTVAPFEKTKNDLYIVSIGVSDYFDDELDLNYAAKDAKDFAETFDIKKDDYKNIYVKQILDTTAITRNILKAKEWLKTSKPDDMIILFAAGHGFLDNNLNYFFGTSDISVRNPEENGLSFEMFESLVEDTEARKRIILMDACHSGEIDDDEYTLFIDSENENVKARGNFYAKGNYKKIGLDNSFRLMKELFADLRRGSGAIVISSAAGVEYAYESPKYKNGIFTYVLIDGLKSKNADLNSDGKITVSELRDYTVKTVSELTGGRQNPTIRRNNSDYNFKIW